MMSLFLLGSSSSTSLWELKKPMVNPLASSKELRRSSSNVRLSSPSNKKNGVKACFFNPPDEPILKEALKEPVAFMGGMFAGLLRLDLKEDPLNEWITRTVEASGVTREEIDGTGSALEEEEAPQQIEIE